MKWFWDLRYFTISSLFQLHISINVIPEVNFLKAMWIYQLDFEWLCLKGMSTHCPLTTSVTNLQLWYNPQQRAHTGCDIRQWCLLFLTVNWRWFSLLFQASLALKNLICLRISFFFFLINRWFITAHNQGNGASFQFLIIFSGLEFLICWFGRMKAVKELPVTHQKPREW